VDRCLPSKSFNVTVPDSDFFVTGEADCLSVSDCCRLLKTHSTIPFGWLIKRGNSRITLFILFLSGGVLPALLSEGVGVEALMKLPFLFWSSHRIRVGYMRKKVKNNLNPHLLCITYK